MIKKILFFLIAAFIPHSHSLAQDTAFNGDWFITFNNDHRQYRGDRCMITITQNGATYNISHNKDDDYCADYLPEEGTYNMDSSGKLVKGDLKLSIVKGKLVYDNYGHIIMQSKKDKAIASDYFDKGAKLITKTDTFPDMKKEYLTESMKDTKKVLEMDAECVECYYNLSAAWIRLEKYDSVLICYKMMMKLDPQYNMVPVIRTYLVKEYLRVGWEQYGKKGKYALAIKEFNKALYLDSAYADTWNNLGGANYMSKHYREAIVAFKRCLELDPANNDAQRGLEAAEQAMIK